MGLWAGKEGNAGKQPNTPAPEVLGWKPNDRGAESMISFSHGGGWGDH